MKETHVHNTQVVAQALTEGLKAKGDYKLTREEALKKKACVQCAEPFSNKNVKTDAGWRETKLSGMCEICYDKLFDDS